MADDYTLRSATSADQTLISAMQYEAFFDGEHSAIMLREGDGS